MKVFIDKDEWYPVYSVEDENKHGFGVEVDVPPEMVRRWKAMCDEFALGQREMEKALDALKERADA